MLRLSALSSPLMIKLPFVFLLFSLWTEAASSLGPAHIRFFQIFLEISSLKKAFDWISVYIIKQIDM